MARSEAHAAVDGGTDEGAKARALGSNKGIVTVKVVMIIFELIVVT